ncbi:hypothetical protein F0562_000343 [Nyssa sinensis]|uniref:Bifunctional inhibitor/plant lipid transfer protein/seed storage helical domain-containing protein n=1 Tax=Nyssa sinensis TaxID=561372 RepID=A0A5J5C0B7_9ASTE|nr:hypothetical protein F0562_000343 [Nyssa sinensis]
MSLKGVVSLKFTWVLTSLLCVLPTMVKTQMHGCSIEGIDFVQCLDQGKNSISSDSCCTALNQAVQAGFHCLCLLLASFSPLSSTSLLLPLSNCYISAPPLTQCQALVPVLQPPASPMPVLLPPDIQKEQPQPSAPMLVPTPPQEVQLPLNLTTDENSSTVARLPPPSGNAAANLSVFDINCVTSNGQQTKNFLHIRFFLSVTLYFCVLLV